MIEPPAVMASGRPPVWKTRLAPLTGHHQWISFGPFEPSYARGIKHRIMTGRCALPDGTVLGDWEIVARYVDEDGANTSSRKATRSVLWVRYVGRGQAKKVKRVKRAKRSSA